MTINLSILIFFRGDHCGRRLWWHPAQRRSLPVLEQPHGVEEGGRPEHCAVGSAGRGRHRWPHHSGRGLGRRQGPLHGGVLRREAGAVETDGQPAADGAKVAILNTHQPQSIPKVCSKEAVVVLTARN